MGTTSGLGKTAMHGSSTAVRRGPTTAAPFPARLGSMPTIPMGGATMSTTRLDMRERQFVLGPERVRVTILTTGAETDGRHDFTDSWLPAGSITPLHLHTSTRSASGWRPGP